VHVRWQTARSTQINLESQLREKAMETDKWKNSVRVCASHAA
jgi:hypothetical protein